MPVVLKLYLTVLICFIIHHKLLVWLLSFIRVIDCSIRISRSFTRDLQPPGLLHLQYMIMIIKMIEIYSITTAQPYYYLWTYAYCIETIAPCAPLMHFCWSEKKMLCYQPCSTHYAVVQISNCLKRTSVIKVTTTENFYNKFKPSHTVPTTKSTLFMVKKMNGTQRRAIVSPWRMHCMYTAAKVTLNIEKIKHLALAIVELRMRVWRHQASRQAGS